MYWTKYTRLNALWNVSNWNLPMVAPRLLQHYLDRTIVLFALSKYPYVKYLASRWVWLIHMSCMSRKGTFNFLRKPAKFLSFFFCPAYLILHHCRKPTDPQEQICGKEGEHMTEKLWAQFHWIQSFLDSGQYKFKVKVRKHWLVSVAKNKLHTMLFSFTVLSCF